MTSIVSPRQGMYRIQQIKEAEPNEWLALCHAVTQAHRRVRRRPEMTGYPGLTLCEHSGNTPLRFDDSLIRLGVISFNGCRSRQQAGDTFVLTRGMRQLTEYGCHTANLPYSFLVRVVLSLTSHYCPNTWQFTADIPLSDWRQSTDWVEHYLNVVD